MSDDHTGDVSPSPNIEELKADALKRQAQLNDQLKQIQAAVPQLVGQLNQVAGEIAAYDKALGK